MELRLKSGEVVIERPNSHLHNDGMAALLEEALQKVSSQERQFIEAEIKFPHTVGKTILVETAPEDKIVFAQRPKRFGLTRFVKNREAVPCRSITIVLRKGDQGQVPGCYYVLLTAYVGYPTPSEPWNERDFVARENPDIARQMARDFWSNHALVYGSEPVVPGTETTVCPW